MATAKEITAYYEANLGRTPGPEEIKSWQNTGLSTIDIAANIRASDEAKSRLQSQTAEQIISNIYKNQAGRDADAEGLKNYVAALQSGRTAAEISQEINQSLEGQNFDTQQITSLYRQNLQRNAEQEGFQWWLSLAQEQGLTPKELEAILQQSATVEQMNRNIVPGTKFTEMQLADLEADPSGGRYITKSIYDLLPDALNVSSIGNKQVQFVAPVTQKMISSKYGAGGGTFSQTVGVDILNSPAVEAAVQRALNSGAMSQKEYQTLYADLDAARKKGSVADMYTAFNKPKAQVVVDALYAHQMGEANTLAEAKAEAEKRQAVLSAQDPGYYQANFELADAYKAAGLDYPFGRDAYSGYDTRVGQANLLNDQNFNSQVNNLLRDLYGEFGGSQDMGTPLTGQYYSESGLQPGFTPFGTEGTMFRSGVAGYTPDLPSRFQFGAPPVDASFQQYRPGAFQPAGVTTGGFITGYTASGQPIYSQYNNPSQNVPIEAERLRAEQAYNVAPITEANFDAADYLRRYPTVANPAVWSGTPFQHYLEANRLGDVRTATRLPFTYNQPSQLINPSANLQTIAPVNTFFTAPNGQIFASEAAYNAANPTLGG